MLRNRAGATFTYRVAIHYKSECLPKISLVAKPMWGFGIPDEHCLSDEAGLTGAR